MAVEFPAGIYPTSESWELAYKQVKVSPLNRWKAELTFEDLTNEQTKELQAFIYQLRGGANSALIGPFGRDKPLDELFSASLSFLAARKASGTGTISSSKTLNTSVSASAGDIIQIYSPADVKGLYKCLNSSILLDKAVFSSSVSFYLYEPLNKVKLYKSSGTTTSANCVLSLGDYFSINNELKVVTESANLHTDSVISFSPPVRKIYSNTDAVTFIQPKTEMILLDKSSVMDIYGVEYNGKITLSFLESA